MDQLSDDLKKIDSEIKAIEKELAANREFKRRYDSIIEDKNELSLLKKKRSHIWNLITSRA